ncbi:radical SAM family RiPP maturation amino acid epimerase [Streptomyces sp. NPDC049954]|uniref:radical SAM family RiPP maturation amino acid epimerase n=1 Tax=Streptomyces sp. NPDC049954 TaxID=3155779 RepID=UPI003429AA61
MSTSIPAEEFHALLGNSSGVPADYLSDVAWTKRTLERWLVDKAFRERFEEDPAGALRAIGSPLSPPQVLPFLGDEDDRAPGARPELPLSARRYRAFLQEKLAHRAELRAHGQTTSDRRMAVWRARQMKRCVGELGASRSQAIVHAPAAFELSKGCTVGCWFCGVAAPKFDHTWPYSEQNAALWDETLEVMRTTIGEPMRDAFLYWATDPLDNPDYEHFLTAFHDVFGQCPQTTTAIGQKDVERTRGLLELARARGSKVDRFSIIAVSALNRLHEAFSAEELLHVECIPQNKGAAKSFRKSNSGRARKFAHKRGDEMVPEEASSTIACVSGFLFNMVERSVQLITPCDASDRWPLGYWVLDQGTFDTGAELGELVEGMIARNMRTRLRLEDPVRLRPDVAVTVADGELRAVSRGQRLALVQGDLDDLAECLTQGVNSAEDLAVRRERRAGVPRVQTLSWLNSLFEEGLLDEEPEPPAVEPVPVALGMPTRAAAS